MLQIEVTGQEDVQAAFDSLEEALNPVQILDESAALLLHRIRTRFLAQVDPDGIPWKPSMAARIRASKGRGGGTLFNTGRMFHSIQVYKEGFDSRAIGTDVPYAAKHQFGLDGMVVRRFMGFGNEDVVLVEQLIKKRAFAALGVTA